MLSTEPCEPWGLGERRFLLDLIAPTEALYEPRCLGILHRLVLCSGAWYGRDLYPCIFLFPDFVCKEIKFGESAPWKQLHFHYSS